MDELIKYMRALVYLQLQAQAEGRAFQKPEVLLSEAGFTHAEIATILRKKQPAVAKTISRARKAQEENQNGSE